MNNKKSELEILKAFPQWQNLSIDLQNQADTLHKELTAIDYNRDNNKRFTLDDIKRAELSILEMLIELPNTLIEELESVTNVWYDEIEQELE